jgi:ankyrin repeat protein
MGQNPGIMQTKDIDIARQRLGLRESSAALSPTSASSSFNPLLSRKIPSMQKKFWAYLLGLAFAMALSSSAAEGPAELLQKGLFEEEANHNLESAIKAYQSVIQQTDEQRKLGATAIFRLGECFRKLGQTNEALVQYRRVLKEFPEQEKLTHASQQLLNEFQRPTPSTANQIPGNAGIDSPLADPFQVEELRRIKALVKESPDLVNSPVNPNRSADRTAQKPLHLAATQGWGNVAEFLITNHAEINITDSERKTPLHYAAASGQKAIVDLLLARGADVDASDTYGFTPLHVAARRGFKGIVEVLLAGKAQVNARTKAGGTPLHYAAENGHRLVGEVLLQYKADLNARGTGQVPDSGLAAAAGVTPLHVAAASDHTSFVEFLCAAGADVNAKDDKGQTPLYLATAAGSARTAEILCRFHADPNSATRAGTTALVEAIGRGSPDLSRLLLARGANLNSANTYGETPLHKAVEAKNPQMVELLLTNKADPNLQNKFGSSPLQYAVSKIRDVVGASSIDEPSRLNCFKIIRLLLEHNADPNLRTEEGRNSLNVFGVPAKSSRADVEEVIALLKQHGAMDEIPDLAPKLNVIRVWRKGLPNGYEIWTKPSSGQNRFTLLEAIWSHYRSSPRRDGFAVQGPLGSAIPQNFQIPTGFRPSSGNEAFDFPDLSRIIIRRMADGKNYRKFTVNLLSNGVIDCNEDWDLVLGDVVEIPEKEHALGAPREGLDETLRSQMKDCVAQHIALVVKGASTEMTLEPGTGRFLSQVMKMPEALKRLVSSSDFSKVKITRADQKTGKTETMTLDETPFREGSKPLSEDFLLQEGDIIEVPDLAKP